MASENVGELLENHEKARNLIKENDVDGRLFRQAAEEGNLNMVKFFLRAKDHIELLPLEKKKCTNEGAVDEDGMTPLHLAASSGHSAVVQCLLSSGAQVNIQNKNKETALFIASREGHKSVVNILLHHGADPFLCCSNEEETAIDIAAARHHCAVVEGILNSRPWVFEDLTVYNLVVEIGVDPNIVDSCGDTMLHLARDVQLVNYLLQCNVLVDARNFSGNTPLHMACSHQLIDIVKILIGHGAYIDSKNKENETPLYLSLLGENFELMKTLLQNYADVNMRCGQDDKTVLQYAIQSNVEGLVQLLLVWDADVNVRDEFGDSPLHEVAELSNVKLAELLIEAGAKVNAVNGVGDTALHCCWSADLAELLLSKGADANICNDVGLTPLEEMKVNAPGQEAVISLLEKHLKLHG